ncbi:DUF6944 family repetitive protein [Peribacillus simplex]|uniref:DUF6944 family repetitive protein n=1 Tax=Peribacillus simplex TaxID=1478 RepID=UPI00366E0576
MGSEFISIFGSVIVAVGTISAALGSTPVNFIKSNLRNDLNLWGNVLQAGGNALQADVQGDVLRTVGKEFQSIGNSIVVTGLVMDFNKEIDQKLFITGNWIQALGGAINVGHGLGLAPFPGHSENIIGNILQATGNSLQAKGGINELRNSDEKGKDQKADNENSLNTKGGVNENKNNGYSYRDYIEQNNEQSETLIVTGSWIQATGSVISAIGTIKEATQDNQSKS